MTAPVFVDTNILVYARDLQAGAKRERAAAVVAELWERRTGRTSVQVLNEYFVTVTRKLTPGLPAQLAWQDVSALQAWSPVEMNWPLLQQAQTLFRDHSLSWWDALVIAAAQRAGCETLWSEDLSAGQVFGTLRIVNPLL